MTPEGSLSSTSGTTQDYPKIRSCLDNVLSHFLNSGKQGHDHFCRKPVLVPDHCLDEEPFPVIQPDSTPQNSSMPFPQSLSLSPESRAQHCPSAFLRRNYSCHEASPQPSSAFRFNKPRYLSCSSYVFPSRPFTIFVALLWILSNYFMSSLYCGTQKCTQYVR